MKKSTRLRELIRSGQTLIMPDAYDGGFSGRTSVTSLCLPT